MASRKPDLALQVLRMIAEDVIAETGASLAADMVASLRDLFVALDTDSSGGIDADELAAGLEKRGYRVTRHEVDQLIERMDLNQDGNIAWDEFSSALVDWKMLQADGLWAAWVDVAFGRLDANGDGEISLDEILAHLPLLSTDPDDDAASERLLEARRMLREADENGDGVISKREFHDLFLRQSTPDGLEQYDARYTPPLSNGVTPPC